MLRNFLESAAAPLAWEDSRLNRPLTTNAHKLTTETNILLGAHLATATIYKFPTLCTEEPDRALDCMLTKAKYLQRHPMPSDPKDLKSTPPSSHKRWRNTWCTTYWQLRRDNKIVNHVNRIKKRNVSRYSRDFARRHEFVLG